MARYNKTDVTLGGLIAIPRDRYTVRITKASKGVAQKSGNPKAVLQFEIVAPETITVSGQEMSIAGRTFQIHHTLVTDQPWGVGRLIQALEKAHFDFTKFNAEGELDDDRLEVLEGFGMDMVLSSEEQIRQRPPTPDEIEAGKTGLQNILDGEGRPVKLGWLIRGDLGEVVGPASVKSADPAWA